MVTPTTTRTVEQLIGDLHDEQQKFHKLRNEVRSQTARLNELLKLMQKYPNSEAKMKFGAEILDDIVGDLKRTVS